MALSGIQIFKMLPKKNCKECGCPTCMAFSMKVAQGALKIEQCPHVSSETAVWYQAWLEGKDMEAFTDEQIRKYFTLQERK